MKKSIFTLLLGSTLLLTSCGEKKENNADNGNTSTEQSSNEASSKTYDADYNLLTDVKTLQKAEDELKNLQKFKGKEIQIFQKIYFYGDGRIVVSLQDPSKPENIDSYTFKNGKWEEPEAVKITGDGDMSANLIPMSEIKFETAATIYKQLEEKAKTIEGGKASDSMYYILNMARKDKLWMTSIEGTRDSYSGYFLADGTLKEFSKD
ncbi:hypothetical protein [Chryseobacterium sp.]|uniref:hypothetical protein n=1 Tax=Chryseobacterium sp. TaxID=1871047 RepID=UPI00388D342B